MPDTTATPVPAAAITIGTSSGLTPPMAMHGLPLASATSRWKPSAPSPVPASCLVVRDADHLRGCAPSHPQPDETVAIVVFVTVRAAVTMNVTATEPDQAGFVTVYPCDAARPEGA